MDDDDPRYYQKLDLDQKRIRAVGYGFLDIPISLKHAEDIGRKTRQAEEQRNRKRPAMSEDSDSSSWDHVSQASQRPFSPSVHSSSGRQNSPTPISASIVPATRIGHDPDTDRQPLRIPIKGGYTAEILAANQWPIVLWSGNEQLFEGIVLLDSGTQDNWISERIVRANKIPCYEDPDDKSTYKDFSGHLVKSCGLVRTEWFYQNRRMPVTFRIAPKDGPFDTLFGYAYLLGANLMTFNNKTVGKGVLPLVKATKKPTPEEQKAIDQNHAKVQSEAEKIRHYREWRKRMQSDGWQWDEKQNKYFKDIGAGRKEWHEEGYQLNVSDSDPLQGG